MKDIFDDGLKGLPIIDTHLHLGPLSYLYMPSNEDEDNVITSLKRFGVKKAICAHHGALASLEYGTRLLMDALDRHCGFLYGYLVFNPNHEELSLELIKKHIGDDRIRGIKIHPSWHLCYPYDPRYEKFWNLCEKKNIIVLTHSWDPDVPNAAQKYSSPLLFEEVLVRYPGLKLILAHAGGRGKMLYKVLEMMKRLKNLYVDFAGDTFVPGLIEDYIGSVGSRRLLFGTDTPWADIRFHLANILASRISIKDKENILSNNATDLFNL
jgi:uncharacterized protein